MKRALAIAIILVLCSAGCTSSNPASASPFAVQVSGTAAPGQNVNHDIVSPHDGALTVSLTWTTSSTGLKVILTQAGCVAPNTSTCPIVGNYDHDATSARATGTVKAGPPQLTAWVVSYSGPQTLYTARIEVK